MSIADAIKNDAPNEYDMLLIRKLNISNTNSQYEISKNICFFILCKVYIAKIIFLSLEPSRIVALIGFDTLRAGFELGYFYTTTYICHTLISQNYDTII